ncbi:MAG: hypothetical protein ACLFVJ_07335 [Persicimonas sp.]
MATRLKAVLWRRGAGKITDAEGKQLKGTGDEVGHFEPERADRLKAMALAEPHTDEEADDGDDRLRSDGGGRAGEAPAEQPADGDNEAGLDE